MRQELRVSCVQFNIRLGEIEINLAKALDGLRQVAASGTRLAVLPEMWSSGYDYKNLQDLAERTPYVVAELLKLTAEFEMVVVGSLPERDGDTIYNTAYVLDSGQQIATYRKLHLFSSMGEDRYLKAGDKTLVCQTSAGRIGVAICYDLRFPELFRKLALEGAEIICLPAEWPVPRDMHWRTLLRARAIENQLFIAATNCCGRQGKLDFFGMSLLISPRGEIFAEGGSVDTLISATFDPGELELFRSQIKCYTDRRAEVYGHLP